MAAPGPGYGRGGRGAALLKALQEPVRKPGESSPPRAEQVGTLLFIFLFVRSVLGLANNSTSGGGLTKAYDITIQRYRKSQTKYKSIKCIFCDVWVQHFVWNFTQNFETINRNVCILQVVENWMNYDILELWHLKS